MINVYIILLKQIKLFYIFNVVTWLYPIFSHCLIIRLKHTGLCHRGLSLLSLICLFDLFDCFNLIFCNFWKFLSKLTLYSWKFYFLIGSRENISRKSHTHHFLLLFINFSYRRSFLNSHFHLYNFKYNFCYSLYKCKVKHILRSSIC